jgi:hypothetical protein
LFEEKKMSNGKVLIHGKEYATVAFRVSEFRKKFPDWEIHTEIIEANDSKVVMQAYIYNKENRCIATGHAEEFRASSSINKTSALENAETSAVGRALSFAGFGGTEFIASAEEMIKVAIDAAPKPKPKTHLKVEKNLRECKNLAELQQAWLAMSAEERVALEAVKDEVKKGLE